MCAEEYGNIIDDARTLLVWRPILPLLKAWQDSSDTTAKFRAAIRVAQFVASVTDAGPKTVAALTAADRIVGAMAIDPVLRKAIEEAIS